MFYCWTCGHDKPDAERVFNSKPGRCLACRDKPKTDFTGKNAPKRKRKTQKEYTSGRVGKFFSENFD